MRSTAPSQSWLAHAIDRLVANSGSGVVDTSLLNRNDVGASVLVVLFFGLRKPKRKQSHLEGSLIWRNTHTGLHAFHDPTFPKPAKRQHPFIKRASLKAISKISSGPQAPSDCFTALLLCGREGGYPSSLIESYPQREDGMGLSV